MCQKVLPEKSKSYLGILEIQLFAILPGVASWRPIKVSKNNKNTSPVSCFLVFLFLLSSIFTLCSKLNKPAANSVSNTSHVQ